jgi:hypothetical protein
MLFRLVKIHDINLIRYLDFLLQQKGIHGIRTLLAEILCLTLIEMEVIIWKIKTKMEAEAK